MKLLNYNETQSIIGKKKVCYCVKSNGEQLPSRKPTSPEKCHHYCCNIIHTDIISWAYIRDGVPNNGICPTNTAPGPSHHKSDEPISGPTHDYLGMY